MTDRKTETRADYRHTLAIPVRWMDCDAYGHVNNAIYYAMMDQVVTVYIVETGVIAMGTSPSIGLCVSSACDFHQPIEFPEVVDARLRIARLGDKSVRYEVGLFRAGEDHPASTGHFVHVYVDRTTRRPISLTPEQRAALAPLIVWQPCLDRQRAVRPPRQVDGRRRVSGQLTTCGPDTYGVITA